MKTFDFIQVTISHNLKDPHPKALEPDCLSPFIAITTQSQRAGSLPIGRQEGAQHNKESTLPGGHELHLPVTQEN